MRRTTPAPTDEPMITAMGSPDASEGVGSVEGGAFEGEGDGDADLVDDKLA